MVGMVRRCHLLFQEGLEGDEVGIECNDATFLTSFQEGPQQKLFFQEFKILQVRWQTVL